VFADIFNWIMSQAISVDGLFVRYGRAGKAKSDAVSGLSFEVSEGEIVGFLGPNGAGKSSTLKALMGFLEPASGECKIFGRPAGSVEARSFIGYLPEVAMYYPYLTPLETLTLYGELQGLRGKPLREEAVAILERLGLASSIKTANRKLSKGMLQRVGIAQALLGSPKLLVLDEVTSGLDPLGRQELREILRERQREGATLFFSSHELSEVENLCDRMLLIQSGKLVEERAMRPLQDELRSFVIVYSGSVSLIGLTEDWSVVSPGLNRASFHTKEDFIKAIERIWAQGGGIVDIVAREGSLEQYFIETLSRAA
jgi:ABC-2 type transport system ATP-binding protein